MGHEYTMRRGARHSSEKAYEIFSEQKDLTGFLMDFSLRQKDFCQRCTRFLGVRCPSQCDNVIEARRPDIVIIDKKEN